MLLANAFANLLAASYRSEERNGHCDHQEPDRSHHRAHPRPQRADPRVGKQAGGAYLDAYEKTLESIADYQENVAKQTDVEWVSTVVDAQARFTRELTKLYVDTGRDLLKK